MMCHKSKICVSNAWVCDGDLGRIDDKVVLEKYDISCHRLS